MAEMTVGRRGNMKLTDHFTDSEFACACGCGFGLGAGEVSRELLDKLELVRQFVGAMPVTSGCRCSAHNKAIGGADTSAHCFGLAADIACPTSGRAFELIAAAISPRVGFVRIGLERGCVHLDVSRRPEHPQRVLFGWDRLAHIGG